MPKFLYVNVREFIRKWDVNTFLWIILKINICVIMEERKTIYLCLAHMSEDGMEQKYVKEAFDTNWGAWWLGSRE